MTMTLTTYYYEPPKSNLILPIYTQTALDILNAAFTYFRRKHPGSILKLCPNPQFNETKAVDGAICFDGYRYMNINIMAYFAKSIKELLTCGCFINPQTGGVINYTTEERLDHKSVRLFKYPVTITVNSYSSKKGSDVLIKISDAWLLYDFLHDKCSLNGLVKKNGYTEEQIKKVIGEPRNPIQIEMMSIKQERLKEIKAKFFDLIEIKRQAIINQVNSLYDELNNYKTAQEELMQKELDECELEFSND